MTPCYLLAGQSNMVGGVVIADLPDECRVWPAGYQVIGEGGIVDVLSRDRCGPELGFAQELADRGQMPAVMVKYAKGGTNLANDWSPDGGRRMPEEDTHHEGGCWARFLAAWDHARKAHPEGLDVRAFVWMQGERDCTQDRMAPAYGDHLRELIDRVRALVGKPDLAMVIGRVTPRVMAPDGRRWVHQHREVVRAAQVSVAEADPHACWVDTDDLPQRADALHFQTPGGLALGRRFAAAVV